MAFDKWKNKSVPRLNRGGMPDLNDPSNKDTIPAMLTEGEYVLNKEATRMFKPHIEAMNRAGLQQRHAENQMVMRNMGGPLAMYNEGGEAGWKEGKTWDGISYKYMLLPDGNIRVVKEGGWWSGKPTEFIMTPEGEPITDPNTLNRYGGDVAANAMGALEGNIRERYAWQPLIKDILKDDTAIIEQAKASNQEYQQAARERGQAADAARYQAYADAEAQQELMKRLVDTQEEIYGQEGTKLLYDPQENKYYKQGADGKLRPAQDVTGALKRAIDRYETKTGIDGQNTGYDDLPVQEQMVQVYQDLKAAGYSDDFAFNQLFQQFGEDAQNFVKVTQQGGGSEAGREAAVGPAQPAESGAIPVTDVSMAGSALPMTEAGRVVPEMNTTAIPVVDESMAAETLPMTEAGRVAVDQPTTAIPVVDESMAATQLPMTEAGRVVPPMETSAIPVVDESMVAEALPMGETGRVMPDQATTAIPVTDHSMVGQQLPMTEAGRVMPDMETTTVPVVDESMVAEALPMTEAGRVPVVESTGAIPVVDGTLSAVHANTTKPVEGKFGHSVDPAAAAAAKAAEAMGTRAGERTGAGMGEAGRGGIIPAGPGDQITVVDATVPVPAPKPEPPKKPAEGPKLPVVRDSSGKPATNKRTGAPVLEGGVIQGWGYKPGDKVTGADGKEVKKGTWVYDPITRGFWRYGIDSQLSFVE